MTAVIKRKGRISKRARKSFLFEKGLGPPDL